MAELLSKTIGVHYQTWDVMFTNPDGSWRVVPINSVFVTKHLGLAFCVATLLVHAARAGRSLSSVFSIGLSISVIGEIIVRWDVWYRMMTIEEALSSEGLTLNDFSRINGHSLATEYMGAIAPALIAGLSVAALAGRWSYRRRAEQTV
jgi:hypothetical protein